jgi:hypothetical protein
LIRLLSLAAVAALVAGSASAAELHIKVEGRPDAAVQQDIRVAAHKVCDDGVSLLAIGPRHACFTQAVQDAQSQLTEVRTAEAKTSNVRVASTR